MELYTIGFTRKSAASFFGLLQASSVDLLLDVRLKPNSQLAGFARGSDLPFFLERLCSCAYRHEIDCAPDKPLLDAWQDKKAPISWSEYERRYSALLARRRTIERFPQWCSDVSRVCLLCSEPEPSQCHRRLLAEELSARYGYRVTHL